MSEKAGRKQTSVGGPIQQLNIVLRDKLPVPVQTSICPTSWRSTKTPNGQNSRNGAIPIKSSRQQPCLLRRTPVDKLQTQVTFLAFASALHGLEPLLVTPHFSGQAGIE
ncbi:hypothetical protein AJ78_02741 [Emergomyces pasteurianus Ep9510]|uniref:Uncharacterized protein n=1 Tax=Emergomyces pasteurianus Ep9510 TaxID=1447872 RepID=A0A1J9QA81_9EURO|nr:hypothetical protein AJ78_02741 [Emergomyces pasteurianus Ep9510]